MDGHTELDANDDWRYHMMIVNAIAEAGTNEEVAEIRASCTHTYKTASRECWHCGHVETAEEREADTIPF
jgi:hypothetical protein